MSKKPSQILTIGSITFDLFLKAKDISVMRISEEAKCTTEYMMIPYGGKIWAHEVHEAFGGGAHNTAVGLSRLGLAATPRGVIGRDFFGNQILAYLQKEKVSAAHITFGKKQTGFSLILNSFEGERTVLHHPGANEECTDIASHVFENIDGLFLNHLSEVGQPMDSLFKKVTTHFQKFPQKFLAWNPGKEQLRKGLAAFRSFLKVVDVLLINREEAELFTGITAEKSIQEQYTRTRGAHFIPKKSADPFPHYAANYKKIFAALLKTGVRYVVITDGQRGAQLSDGKQIFFCSIDETSPRVDTLGAGDAFGSGLFFALWTKKDLPFAMKCGTMNAASVIAHVGAQEGLLTAAELTKRAQKSTLLVAKKSL